MNFTGSLEQDVTIVPSTYSM